MLPGKIIAEIKADSFKLMASFLLTYPNYRNEKQPAKAFFIGPDHRLPVRVRFWA
jgi:hypothetical protein